MTNETTTAKFQVGQTYMTRSVCDYDCKVAVTVAKRTAKFITTTEGKRLGVRVWDGVEQVKPWGSYSMAPSVGADQRVEQSETVPDLIKAAQCAIDSGFEVYDEYGKPHWAISETQRSNVRTAIDKATD